MHSNLGAHSTDHNPIPVDDNSNHFEAMLFIITGRHQRVLHQERTIGDADRLYRMAHKYQLAAHQDWFSEMYGNQASLDGMGAAIAALFAACEGPVIDKTLATRAIRDGFSNMAPKPWNSKRCLLDNQSRLPGELLAPSDLTLAFRNTLGLKGLAAYTHTFARLPQVAPDWEALALSTTGQRARR